MATDASNKRSYRLNMRITEETRYKLETLSSELGLAPATVASYALSEWLHGKQLQRQMIEQATGTMVKQTIAEDQLALLKD